MELFSYVFSMQGVLVGPLVFYNDYIEFVNGESIKKHTKTSYTQPSVIVRNIRLFSSVLKKFILIL